MEGFALSLSARECSCLAWCAPPILGMTSAYCGKYLNPKGCNRIIKAFAAADEESERSHLEETVQQLISILGAKTSTLEARRLLFKAGGDLERALNLHYNDSETAGEPILSLLHLALLLQMSLVSPDHQHPGCKFTWLT